MKAFVDKDLCIGCGACCAITDGEVFEFSDEGYAKAKDDVVLSGELLDKAKEACDNCPTSAIRIEEEDKNN